MTVAAGFVCHNGVILGADTEITFPGTGKTNESKLFPINREMGCYLTYTGVPDFAKELADRLRNKTKGEGADEILRIMRQEYKEMREVQDKKPKEERTWADFLITVRRDVQEPFKTKIYDYEAELYAARNENFFKVDKFLALGIGEELAAALFEPLYLKFSTRENAYLMVYAIKKIKQSIQGVGGRTEIIEIPNSDALPFADLGKLEIEQIEKDFDFLEEKIRPLLIAFPSEMTKQNFQLTLARFTKELKQHRKDKAKKP
jgi:20S proteasome alpha/beta subunit